MLHFYSNKLCASQTSLPCFVQEVGYVCVCLPPRLIKTIHMKYRQSTNFQCLLVSLQHLLINIIDKHGQNKLQIPAK